ncbi:alkylation response protein AidB-like acyl-CoA dehydrogenase [Micromonospora jinlongensis]|uniref:Alkylation response protein AidB-like acyl-CoA dehydrogenase n=1 Tax=Micromonospora jinlongensis TaxID=1287877 RepID=A0A7Y9WW06_9ACTN|nr:acyl-CoA dehydrogenase family protein [Micromonospora jinlongensis]NYH40591.1 alkylation response protein AidB-like acyl-CoA dehydrogenase [Micromonospora jinlongensis]
MTTTVDNAHPITDVTSTLGTLIDDVIRPQATTVDREGVFPRQGVDALAAAGLLGLASSTEVGGGGHGMRVVAAVVERLAAECGSTAMVVLMHYAATAVIEAHGPREVRAGIATGGHLTTLAFSEYGSRSHFWSPTGTATATDDGSVRLDARKSWVTSAGEVDSYVWSSLPVTLAAGPMTLWLVPAGSAGLSVTGDFDGLGLRGNGSRPMTADGLRVPSTAMMAADGAGLDTALGAVLPWFLVLNAAFCLGLAQSAVAEAGRHVTRTTLAHTGAALRDAPVTRRDLARLMIRTDALRAFLGDTLTALETGRDDAMLRVLQVKALAGETVADVTDGAMQLCGGSAFRKELGLERRFRDSRAARVMAPTTDALHDFVGRVATGLPLLDEANR